MADCVWSNRNFPPRPRAGGSPQRFCCAAHRTALWSALRRWGERAVAAGVLSIDQIRNGSLAACALRNVNSPPAGVPAADPQTPTPFSLPKTIQLSTPGILGDLPDRRLDGLADDLDADLLVAVERV